MAEQVDNFIRSESNLSDEDADLVEQIRKVLWSYEPLRASRPRLEVRVDGGRVTLSGRMRTLAMKEISEYLLRRLDGVNAVRNDVVADPEVIQAVADALATDSELGPLCIRVDARDGDVVLAGDVASEALADRAIDVASRVPVAERVGSRMRVEATATNGSITAPVSPGRGSELEPEIGAHDEP